MGRRRVLTGAVLVVGLGAAGMWWGLASRGAPAAPAANGVRARVRQETRPTLDPALFVGKARRAHEVARAMPDVLDELYCYCGCDRSAGHKSLLSCYTDGHAPT